MSSCPVSVKRRNSRAIAAFAFAVLSCLACALTTLDPVQANAQPTSKNKENSSVDTRDPIPADTPKRKALERVQVQNRDRAIFAAIEDFKPVASQDKNNLEYLAWIELFQHASQQSTAELNDFAIRDLVPLDLLKELRGAYRTELVRFDGKLTCIRRLHAPPMLKEGGIQELYEARLVPIDESPLTPISIVFIDLPEALAEVRRKAPEEWLDVNNWVTASGYYFKTMSVPGDQANAVTGIPVLIGRGLTVLLSPHPSPEADNPVALDRNIRVYKFIKDDAPMVRNKPTEVAWPEIAAYNRVILHASRFRAEELEQHAQTGLKFADLVEAGRVDYKLHCVRFEGRLISLSPIKVSDWLASADVKTLYEGWLVPANEPRGNPVCIVFTEPLAGVEPTGRVNKWVSFAGYSFKLMRYESAERYPDDPTRNVVKRAPLLIGRGAIVRTDPDQPTGSRWGLFVRVTMLVIAGLIIGAGILTWLYRRGDSNAQQQKDGLRHRNPFDANTTPPGTEPTT